jgi:hypothetical protein
MPTKQHWFGGGANGRGRALDLHRASFGTWVELSKRLAATGRDLLSTGGERAAAYMRLFTATDPAPVEALTSQNLTRILVEARDHRNRWSGHGGVAGTQVNLERLKDCTPSSSEP